MLNATTIKTINELLEAEIDLATSSIAMYWQDGSDGKQEVIDWTERLVAAVNARADFAQHNFKASRNVP